MCFSAQASFAVGAALLPAGIYSTRQALIKKPKAVLLAVVPLVFGIQQLCEGWVWMGLHGERPEEIRRASLAFLFFAIAFWPFWFPLVASVSEPPGKKKTFFIGFAIASTFFFWAMYLPLVFGPPELLTTHVVHHSIQYYYPDLWIYEHVPKTPLRVLYFVMVALPMFLSSESLGAVPGICLGISVGVAIAIYDYAFVSVWCFFAAVMSAQLAYMFWKMPIPAATSSTTS